MIKTNKNKNKNIKKSKYSRYLNSRGITTNELLLSMVAVAGVLAVGAVAPKAIMILKKSSLFKKYHKPCYFKARLSVLQQRGLIEYSNDGEIRLTVKGEKELEKQRIFDKREFAQKKWNGRWYVVMFDIIEGRKKTRDALRFELENYGFKKVQNSVWVYPYECTDFIALIKTDLSLGRSVLCFHAEFLDSDTELRELFGLPNYSIF